MSINPPWPYYPDFQNLSATFSTSGNITVNTKFRQVDSYVVQPIFTGLNASTIGALGAGYAIATSRNAGQITLQLNNNSTQISSALGVYIWATGIM